MTCIDKILLAFVVVQVAFALVRSFDVEGEDGLHINGVRSFDVEGEDGLHINGVRSFDVEGEDGLHINGDVSIIPEECGVKYEKVGCFNKKTKARTLSVLIFSDRKTGSINWKAWEKHLKSLACRCAVKSCDKGYDYFGLQFYGECWSGPDAADKFDHYGRSKKCVGYGYKKCDDKDSSECVGGRHKSYVYRVVKEGGSGSGDGYAPTA